MNPAIEQLSDFLKYQPCTVCRPRIGELHATEAHNRQAVFPIYSSLGEIIEE
jgi:hypothetical protein